jgi:hypothetical protein
MDDEYIMTLDDVFKPSEKDKILHMKSMVKSYLNMVLNEEMLDDVGHYLVAAGGAFVTWFDHTSELKDIDVFVLHDPTAKNKLRLHLENNGFKQKNSEYLKQTNPGAKHVQEIWEGLHRTNGRKYQFIFTDYWSREELIREFDYKHCMVSYDVGKNMIYITRQIYDAIANKHLIVNNDKRVAEWRRTKFLQRGFTEYTKEEKFVPWSRYSTNLAADAIADAIKEKLMKELEVNGQ